MTQKNVDQTFVLPWIGINPNILWFFFVKCKKKWRVEKPPMLVISNKFHEFFQPMIQNVIFN